MMHRARDVLAGLMVLGGKGGRKFSASAVGDHLSVWFVGKTHTRSNGGTRTAPWEVIRKMRCPQPCRFAGQIGRGFAECMGGEGGGEICIKALTLPKDERGKG